MSTWGWVIEYGIVAVIVVMLALGFLALWGQDQLWRWQDRRDAKRERAAGEDRRRVDNGS